MEEEERNETKSRDKFEVRDEKRRRDSARENTAAGERWRETFFSISLIAKKEKKREK